MDIFKFDVKVAVAVFVALLCSVIAEAQVYYIDQNLFYQTTNVRMKLKVREASSKEAMPFVSVYLIPAGDTSIVHFALTDEKGNVKIEKIVPGKYSVNVENIGYKSYSKIHELIGYEKDLGVIELEENPEFIDAASITAMGDPVVMKQDTIVYNAAAFRVGTNDMLEDLLKRMPGMEVDSEGNVKVNGEKVDKITVGGKTFFFNDPTMAVKNLPAKIVDKIKVIDKDNKSAEFSGISTKDDKEKVMDIELKEEYKKGWFGNASINGGATLESAEQRKKDGVPAALYQGSMLVAGYNEKDQLTILGSGNNGKNPRGGAVVVFGDSDSVEQDEFSMKPGIKNMGQFGLNYNTARVEGYDTDLSASWNYSGNDSRTVTRTTSVLNDGKRMYGENSYLGVGNDNKLKLNFGIEKQNRKKFALEVRPVFSWVRQNRNISNASSTSDGTGLMNSGDSHTTSSGDQLSGSLTADMGFKGFGKDKRNISLNFQVNYSHYQGVSRETSTLTYRSGEDEIKDLNYDKLNRNFNASGNISYVEPFGDHWKFLLRGNVSYADRNILGDAFNFADGSRNEYYSSLSRSRNLRFNQRILGEYKPVKNFKFQFGASVFEQINEIHTKSRGIENISGKNEWLFNWAPSLSIDYRPDRHRLLVSYDGRSNAPSGSRIAPVLNLNDPVRITLGNAWLKPEFQHNLYLHANGRTEKGLFNWDLSTSFRMYQNKTVTASWFDSDGVNYAIPVNSRHPSAGGYINSTGIIGLDKNRRFSIQYNLFMRGENQIGYQSLSRSEGIDRDNFDYSGFMNEFWGSPEGDRFYGGQSGFAESNTTTLDLDVSLHFNYRGEHFGAILYGEARRYYDFFSLDPTANSKVSNLGTGAYLNCHLNRNWEISTDFEAKYYFGYSEGFNTPEYIWNASVSKTIKSITLSISAFDMLNQTKRVSRVSTAELIREVKNNTLGRCILGGVSFTFGKMNAKNNSKAQNAMWKMML